MITKRCFNFLSCSLVFFISLCLCSSVWAQETSAETFSSPESVSPVNIEVIKKNKASAPRTKSVYLPIEPGPKTPDDSPLPVNGENIEEYDLETGETREITADEFKTKAKTTKSKFLREAVPSVLPQEESQEVTEPDDSVHEDNYYQEIEDSLNEKQSRRDLCGTEGREIVSNTTAFPYSTSCKLYMTWGSNNYLGSGNIITSVDSNSNYFYVLTAGHCVYKSSLGGWADSIEVVPGLYKNTKPFGTFSASRMWSVNGWIDGEDSRYDWAVIRVTGNPNTGALGWSYNPPSSYDFNLIGYPGEGFPYENGKVMTFQYEDTGSIGDYVVKYWHDTARGMSGSTPYAFIESSGQRYVYGIHVRGGCPNEATKMQKYIYDSIKEFMKVEVSSISIDKNGTLSWNSNTSNLIGYNILRRAEGETEFKKVNDKIIQSHTKTFVFRDRTALPGKIYQFEAVMTDGSTELWKHNFSAVQL